MNVLLFHKEILQEKYFTEGATESIYKAEDNLYHEQRRDILKDYQGMNMVIMSFGIENQSTIDAFMPIRIMGYDYASYRGQIYRKEKLHPVITLVLNFSKEDWNEPCSLIELLDVPEIFQQYVADYSCKIIDVHRISEDTIAKFTSDFKEIAQFFKYGENYLEVSQQNEPLDHPIEVIEFLEVFSNADMKDTKQQFIEMVHSGRCISMCTIVQDIEEKGRIKGVYLGRVQTLIDLVESNIITTEQAAQQLQITQQEFMQMMKEQKSEIQ